MLSFSLCNVDHFEPKKKGSMKFKLTNLDVALMYPFAGSVDTWAGWGYLPAWLITPKYAARMITALIVKEKLDGRVLHEEDEKPVPGRICVSPATKKKEHRSSPTSRQ